MPKHSYGNGAGDDADALTDLEKNQKAKQFSRQSGSRKNSLILKPGQGGIHTGICDDGEAKSEKDATDKRADEIQKHAADGSDEYRHGLPPSDDSIGDEKTDEEENSAKMLQGAADLRKRQRDLMIPDGNDLVADALRSTTERISLTEIPRADIDILRGVLRAGLALFRVV